MLFHKSTFFTIFTLCFLFTGCASKGYTHHSSSHQQIKNSPNMHKATMRPYVVNGKRYYPTQVSVGDQFSGMASWYGKDFHGKHTSNGEIYNMYAISAAHKILPMNTMVKVTNLLNGKTLVVRINDRGPFVESRIIDLSYAAAKKLDIAQRGTAPVRLEIMGFHGVVKSKSQQKESVNVGDFLVQIGAFRNIEGSKSYARKLQNKYRRIYKVFIKRSIYQGSYIYRVYLKGFKSEDEARDFIYNEKYDGAFIVRD